MRVSAQGDRIWQGLDFMIMRKVALAAAVVSLLSAAAAQAATHYSGILFFGDSLSDRGNLYELTSATIGQVSRRRPISRAVARTVRSGPTISRRTSPPRGCHSANYAYAYGQAVPTSNPVPAGFQAPDLPAQIDGFKASSGATSAAGRWRRSGSAATTSSAPCRTATTRSRSPMRRLPPPVPSPPGSASSGTRDQGLRRLQHAAARDDPAVPARHARGRAGGAARLGDLQRGAGAASWRASTAARRGSPASTSTRR